MKAAMKVLTIAGLCAMSAGAFAGNSTAPVKWFGTVPGVFPGSDITITGPAKGDIQDGILMVDNDGTFVSQDVVTLESHDYTPKDGTTEAATGDLKEATWTLSNVAVIPGSYDTSDIKVSFNNELVAPGADFSTSTDTVNLTVKDETANDSVVPGDQVRVTTTVIAKTPA
ncbi:TPA: hypothetical protein ACX6SD_003861 [Photobacterium damselae]